MHHTYGAESWREICAQLLDMEKACNNHVRDILGFFETHSYYRQAQEEVDIQKERREGRQTATVVQERRGVRSRQHVFNCETRGGTEYGAL